jgi:hypothetical protein
MIIPVAALAMLLLPALLGGRLGRLGDVRLLRVSLIVVTLVVQVVVVLLPIGPHWLPAATHVATYLAAGVFLWVNRRLPGLVLLALGGACNAVVIAVNGGTLPASPQALELAGMAEHGGDFVNSGALADPKLGFLGDVFAIPASWPLHNVFSVGDVFIVLGVGYASARICGLRGMDPYLPPELRHTPTVEPQLRAVMAVPVLEEPAATPVLPVQCAAPVPAAPREAQGQGSRPQLELDEHQLSRLRVRHGSGYVAAPSLLVAAAQKPGKT